MVKAAAGITFSIVLTTNGKGKSLLPLCRTTPALNLATPAVYAFGSGEHGQLGNGRTGEHIVSAGKTAFDVEYEPSKLQRLLIWHES